MDWLKVKVVEQSSSASSGSLKGIVTYVDDIMYVLHKGTKYLATKDSCSCKDKANIYHKHTKEVVRYLRTADDRSDNGMYIPYLNGMAVFGRLIHEDGIQKFQIVKMQ